MRNDTLSILQEISDNLYRTDIKDWLAQNENNLILEAPDSNDFVLLEPGVLSKVYSGHYFFTSRGKEALKVANTFLARIFQELDLEVLVGFTPIKEKRALWFTRLLGFKSYGRIINQGNDCEFFMLTKQEWKERGNGLSDRRV